MKYIVSHEGQEIPVPESIGSDEGNLRRALASIIPGIAEAKITSVVKDEITTYTVVKTAGTKGAGNSAAQDIRGVLEHLVSCPGGINPVVALYQELQGVDLTTVSAEEALLIDKKIDQIVELGDTQQKKIAEGLKRLADASPQPAPAVILGF